MNSTSSWAAIPKPIFWLALGTFAIGTEGFMIAPLLPGIATDLAVGIATAGQLVTVFALTYAFSSPILTALTGSLGRSRLLVASLGAFAIANIVAWAAAGYWELMAARVLLAFSAGLYVPNANAVAAALVPPDRRGHALSIVSGGTTLAIALGVPLGALVGHSFGWRITFAAVAFLSLAATAGLAFGLRQGLGAEMRVATLRERLQVAGNASTVRALLVTMLWATGAYTIYTYIATYLTDATGASGSEISLLLFLWGVSAAAGVFAGGALTDRYGPRKVIPPSLLILALAFAGLSLTAEILPRSQALLPVVLAIILWGLSAWAFFPAQQTRLIGITGIQVAPIALSLNASFMFIGFACGAALGSFVLNHGPASNLGWVGAACEGAALIVFLASARPQR